VKPQSEKATNLVGPLIVGDENMASQHPPPSPRLMRAKSGVGIGKSSPLVSPGAKALVTREGDLSWNSSWCLQLETNSPIQHALLLEEQAAVYVVPADLAPVWIGVVVLGWMALRR
jgi:hypothetical protein